MDILRFLEASYRLFKVIPGTVNNKGAIITDERLKELEIKYNVMVLRYDVNEIKYMNRELEQLLRMITLSNSDMKKTLFQDLSVVKDSEELARYLTNIHYHTTYGRDLLGLNRDSLPTVTFNKYDGEEIPNYTTVLHIMGLELFIDIVLAYLSSKNRYSQDELEDMIVIIDDLVKRYPVFIDRLKDIDITSNDIRTHLMYIGILPIDKLSDLKKVVGMIALRKNIVTNSDFDKDVNIDVIAMTLDSDGISMLNNILNTNLIKDNVINYAKDFNRNKKFMVFLKKLCKTLYGNDSNYITIINRVSKLSKKLHVPIKEPFYKRLTSDANDINIDDVLDEIKKLEKAKDGLAKLSKLYMAINYRLLVKPDDSNKIPFIYKIRNGKQWFELKDIRKWDDDKLSDILLLVTYGIKSLLVNKLIEERAIIDMPSNVHIATPYSKNNIGSIPTGTTITYGNNDTIVGIYWENIKDNGRSCRVDLDLSMTNISSKIGWDSDYSYNNIIFSGDMTDAENGATELFYLNGVSSGMYRLSVNWYNMSSCDKKELGYKFFISTIDRLEDLKSKSNLAEFINNSRNKASDIIKRVDDSELLFHTMLRQYKKELRLGILNLDNREFIFSRSDNNNITSSVKYISNIDPVEIEYNMLKSQFRLTPDVISYINNKVLLELINNGDSDHINVKKLGFYETCMLLTQNM